MRNNHGEREPLLANSGEPPNGEIGQRGLSSRKLITIVLALGLVFLISSLDETMAAVSAFSIVSQFKAFDLYGWVGISYLVFLNASQPLYAKLSDIFGRKPIILFGVIFLMIGSAGSGWATSMPMFIAARCIAGLGAGGLGGMAFIVVADLVPLDDRPKYQSILATMGGAAFFSGPAIGGVLTEKLSWRWCYWINLPFCLITLVVVLIFLRLPRMEVNLSDGLNKVDFRGALALVLAISCFTIPMSLGGNGWDWNSPPVLSLLLLSIFSCCSFFYIERYHAIEPIVPLRLLKNRNLLAAWGTLFFYQITFVTLFFYLPIWVQVVEGKSPQMAGVQLSPLVGGLVCGGLLYAPLRAVILRLFPAHPPRITLLRLGTLMLITGLLFRSTVTRETPKFIDLSYLSVYGIGAGLTMQTSFVYAQGAVEHQDMAIANSLAVFFQNSGGPIGLAFMGAINRMDLKQRFNQIPSGIVSFDALSSILSDPSLIHKPGFLSDAAREIVIDQFADSISSTLMLTVGFGAAVLVTGLCMRDHEIEEKDPLAEESVES
ncbi:hypothetical protein BOTBODRAFT_188307 [Botryobasidium botryosum FD-172 SS1]|uniref:Major facilitator superfamily (MFS) profile domain-containing protein n=1 Tax=Botryobasidium botryosum (strain FD-172 SS1) TaxID=930990 RepID=A0A067MPS6_BOTB1|nr:hypothetical protein BOTBODRAFT_188307 [Botryobasidium botryosum FD-172 SS1]